MKTAEFVLPGHPDKVCDQIADALLDEFIKQDKDSRCAIEVFGNHGTIFVGGEVSTKGWVDIPKVVNDTLMDIGYNEQFGVISNIVNQSKDIAQGVNKGGAGDQGIMIGYACNETKQLMPYEYQLARDYAQLAYNLKLGPDGKTQVTINKGKVKTLVISAIGAEKENLKNKLGDINNIYINPTGKFEIGGFDADTGMTGRKIVVDQYGPNVPIGGGSFSGKDPTKVDRSGAYMARKIAVEYLKRYEAKEVLVKLAYVIGVAKPVMTQAIIDKNVKLNILDYDLRPAAIIERLNLKKPIYRKTAIWGHFGRGFSWDG